MKKLPISLLLLSFVLLLGSTYAQAFGPGRHQVQPADASGPIRNQRQGQRENCYAHAAADLLSHWLSHHPKLVLDPAYHPNSKVFDDLVSANAITYANLAHDRIEYFQLSRTYLAGLKNKQSIEQLADILANTAKIEADFATLSNQWLEITAKVELPLCNRIDDFGKQLESFRNDTNSRWKTETNPAERAKLEKRISELYATEESTRELSWSCESQTEERFRVLSLLQQIQKAEVPTELTRFVAGGSPKSAIEASLQTGQCLERQVRSQDYIKAPGITDLARVLKDRLALSQNIEEIIADYHLFAIDYFLRSWTKEKIDNEETAFIASVIQPLFPSLTSARIFEILVKSGGKTDPLSAVLSMACNKKIQTNKIPKPVAKISLNSAHKKELMDFIRTNLKEGRPVAIGYYTGVLASVNLPHASVLLESRIIGGEPSFVLRNSWGPGSCEEDRKRMPGKFDCDNGNYLISEKNMEKSIVEAVIIPNK